MDLVPFTRAPFQMEFEIGILFWCSFTFAYLVGSLWSHLHCLLPSKTNVSLSLVGLFLIRAEAVAGSTSCCAKGACSDVPVAPVLPPCRLTWCICCPSFCDLVLFEGGNTGLWYFFRAHQSSSWFPSISFNFANVFRLFI